MERNDRLIGAVKWAYERSPFYKNFYDRNGFSVKDYIDSNAVLTLPTICLDEYIISHFLDLITMPLSAVAETGTARYGNYRFLTARTAQELTVSIEITRKYLAGIGVNRTSVVALEGMSQRINNEISQALLLIGANVFYLPQEIEWTERDILLKELGVDTIISSRNSLENYINNGLVNKLDTLFRVIMISDSCHQDSGEASCKYDELLGAPIYEIISLPWTAALVDLYKTEQGEFIPREGLLIVQESDGIVLTDTDARTIPLLGVKVEW